jgi:23S rRNA 5-hydroxycytidine C2501 synthase
MTKIELMAPAKNAEIGIAAIQCGADAVYIGAERFGAREDAGNSIPDIARLAAYAHQYYAHVYVTLNTILFEEELPAAQNLIHQLYDTQIDGLIIQDMGLLELDLPPIPLIASTQMHNSTPEKILFLEKVGFARAILARELTLEQIREIRQKTTLELECFIHGSLCVGYSGQCYLSYAIGGRSGNRGACAQPCRRKYSLVDAQGKIMTADRYLLSLKDMDRSEYLQRLIETGITSFKIEGRLKDIAYIKNIVGFYRQKLDKIIVGRSYKKSSSGTINVPFSPDPYKTFNRGFTDYGLCGKLKNCASLLTPKSMGEKLGSVISIDNRGFVMDSSQDLHPGDGICFFDQDQKLCGTLVHRVENNRIYPDKIIGITIGTIIYRNLDHVFLKQLDQSNCKRTIGVHLLLAESANGFTLEVEDDDGTRASFSLTAEKKAAEKIDLAHETVQRQLSKMGGTIFHCAGITVNFTTPYFIPIAVLNQLRRGVIDELLRIRSQNRLVPHKPFLQSDAPYPEKILRFTGNVLNKKARDFYQRHGVAGIEPAAESGLDLHGRMVMTTRYCVKQELGLCGTKLEGQKSSEPLYLLDEDGRKITLEFDCQRCGMNIYFTETIKK